MSTNTILMDCNRGQAVDGDQTNSSLWTNEVSSGIQLNPGDAVSVHSAFINEIGSGADTIEFLGRYLADGVYDNKATVSVSYYKNADADNCLILPRHCCWKSYTAATDDGLPDTPGQILSWFPEKIGTAPNQVPNPNYQFNALYRRKHDALRYTIYHRTSGIVDYHPDMALHTFERYRQTQTLSVDTGYNTPADISSRLTETLHASDEPQTQSSDGFPYSIVCDSTIYQRFECANSSNFSQANFATKLTDHDSTTRLEAYKRAFQYIGVLRPDLFEAGRHLDTSKMKVLRYDGTTHYMTLDYPHTPANVALWQALFDAQAAQFDSAELLLNASTTRFIHVNHSEGAHWQSLGHDIDLQYMSVRQPIYNTAAGCIFNDGGRIQFRLQAPVFTGAVTTARHAGWDIHFSAFGNDCLLLWSGVGPTVQGSYTSTTVGTDAATEAGDSTVDKISSVTTIKNSVFFNGVTKALDALVEYVYLGAINPLISFDSSESRFYLSGLHTPRKLRNNAFAGSRPTNPLNPDAGKEIYQINPEYFRETATTVYNPEQRSLATNALTSNGLANSNIDKLNLLAFWKVFDASSGVFIEDWGVPAASWDESLWGKLGFTYQQLHATGHRQARATNTAVNVSPASTNADVNSTQTMGWCVNIYGAPQFISQLPVMGTSSGQETVTYVKGTLKPDGTLQPPVVSTREIFRLGTVTQDATSTRIIALNLPVKQTSSYWTIRSSLLDDSRYFSSHGLMPVIAVVDKSYSGSDFYFMSDSTVQFTITKPRVITAITTSVHLPDGTLARTDGGSCVIYQITKAPPPSKPPNK